MKILIYRSAKPVNNSLSAGGCHVLKRDWINYGEPMNEDTTIKERLPKAHLYFTIRELLIIAFLALLAVLTGTFAPKYLHLGDGGIVPTITHGILKLPGPGTGLMIFGGALCFCLVLGLMLIKKPWTAVVMSVLIIAIDLLIGQETVSAIPLNIHSLDVILFIAIIIEVLAMLSWEKPPLKYGVPVILAGLGAITLFVYLSGQDKIGYVIIAILAFCFALIFYRYPVKYLAACAIANMYYILHFWIFCGDSVAARFPATPILIPVILCAGIVGGVLFATAAYGVDMLLKCYVGDDSEDSRTS